MPAKPKNQTEPELGYEAARERLIEIVNLLETGKAPLSQAMELWEEGEKLASTCLGWLESAKARIETPTAEI